MPKYNIPRTLTVISPCINNVPVVKMGGAALIDSALNWIRPLKGNIITVTCDLDREVHIRHYVGDYLTTIPSHPDLKPINERLVFPEVGQTLIILITTGWPSGATHARFAFCMKAFLCEKILRIPRAG